MSGLRFAPTSAPQPFDRLEPIVADLRARQEWLASRATADLVALLSDFGARLLRDPRTADLEGAAFLAAWLKRGNLERMLELNLGGRVEALDGFVPHGRDRLAARPHGLAALWMAGNVATLPVFGFVPALLARNVCLVKLAAAEPLGADAVLEVLAASEGGAIAGADLCDCLAVVWFSSAERHLSESMSSNADAKVVWGGRAAIEAIRALPQPPHCVTVEFGPKVSIGLIGREILADAPALQEAVTAFVRDIAIFDQRACSSPQTIFVEQPGAHSLRQVGEAFAAAFSKLPAKKGLDAFTTVEIVNARAAWALDPQRDVIASPGGADWTVCMDADVSLKPAVQSRTVFLTAVPERDAILPLLTPGVQTLGMALGNAEGTLELAAAATARGVARCVRPGLMNVQESPWDGKLLINELVRWVALKP